MRYPEFLKPGGRIGIIAPSFGCASEPYRTRFEMALKAFQRMGYKTVAGENCFLECGDGISNTPEKCGAEANHYMLEDICDVIISCAGGELMCEDIGFFDFEAMKEARPKWFMGFSDNTNLTFMLNTVCDTAAIYGPNAAAFGMEPLHPSLRDALELLCGGKLTVTNYDGWEKNSLRSEDTTGTLPYNITEPFRQRIIVGDRVIEENSSDAVKFSGRLIGGCLDCLSTLVGTRFDKVADFNRKYASDGIIWFLESCDLNVMSIRRALWQLENAGWFQNVRGFIIGRPLQYDDTFGDFDRHRAVEGILRKYNVPVVMDTDLGHLAPQMPVISGACADVCADTGSIAISYRLE